MSYEIFSSVYDILTANVDYENFADKIRSSLSLNGVGGGLLLDVGCGAGTLAFLLEKYGYDVIGVDPSEDMLAVANEKKYEENSNALFLCQGMEELDLYGTVDCAVCSLDTINHVDSLKKIGEAFKRISLFMNLGGIFIFDMNTVYKHREILADNTFVYDADDVYCVWQNTFSEGEMKTAVDLDFFIKEEGSEKYERYGESFFEYAYDENEILALLPEYGFTVLNCLDDYSDKEVTKETQRITVIAKKTKLISKDEVK